MPSWFSNTFEPAPEPDVGIGGHLGMHPDQPFDRVGGGQLARGHEQLPLEHRG